MHPGATELLNRAGEKQRMGQWVSAISLCEEAFAIGVGNNDLHAVLDALLSIGSSYRQLSDSSLAEDYYLLADTIASLCQDNRRASRARNGLAILYQEKGELDTAEQMYVRALELASLSDDALAMGRINQNLGTIFNIRGMFSTAQTFYTTSLHCYENIAHQHGIAGVLNNLGMLHIDLHNFDEAESRLDRALQICADTGDIVTKGVIHANLTELFAAKGSLDLAKTHCDRAFAIACQLDDSRIKADALKFYGVIYRQTGKSDLAENHLRQAIEVASNAYNLLTEAECHRELALVLRTKQRNREALEALNEAYGLFTRLRARKDQSDVNHRMIQIESDFLSLVRVWGESIEAKDRYTRGHCNRVAEYACQIAQAVGISPSDLVWFRMGAFLHDIGKMEIPESILTKAGALSDDERTIMERHTISGDEMLAHVSFPWNIRPMIRSHHERWDGRGYPDGTAGTQTPLTARILRIADVFDALTSNRSYRQPLTAEQALQLMEVDHGSFDPELFEVFRGLLPKLIGDAVDTPTHSAYPERVTSFALSIGNDACRTPVN